VSCVGSETDTKCFELCDWFLFELSSDLLMRLVVTGCLPVVRRRGVFCDKIPTEWRVRLSKPMRQRNINLMRRGTDSKQYVGTQTGA
jgi:hypothetical protein